MGQFRRVVFYLWGFVQVFAQAAALAMMVYWLLQFGTLATGAWSFDPVAVYQHLFITFSFLFFFPGQRFWTHTRTGPDGKTYVIVGAKDRVEP